MRIAIISKADASGGGAGKSAETLAKLLLQAGHYVEHHVSYYSKREPHLRLIHQAPRVSLLQYNVRRFSRKIGLPDFISLEYPIFKWRTGLDFEIVQLFDISSAFSPWSIAKLARHIPVVWSFRDCSPFTGGCIQPVTCEKFQTRCHECPQLGRWPLNTSIDRTGFMHDAKRKLAEKELYTPTTPSRWMADMAMSTGMFTHYPEVIPTPVNTEVFRPLEKDTVRRVLGLPTNSFIVLVSSGYIHDPIKGLEHSVEALHKVANSNIHVLVIGHYKNEVLERFSPFDTTYTGYITDKQLLALYYAAADVYLNPTLADNFPNTVLETMAAGTPIVGYATGGVKEMVVDQKTGWLVPTGNVDGLVKGLRFAINNADQIALWSKRGSHRAQTVYSPQQFLESHLNLYDRLLHR